MPPDNRLLRHCGVIIAAGALAFATVDNAEAISIRHDVPVASYNNLANQPEYQAAGYLRHVAFGQWCSGVLLSPTKVLTAAHCVTGISASSLSFGTSAFVGAHTGNVQSINIHPNYGGGVAFDLAVLTLNAPLAGVTPAAFWDGNPLGLVGTMLGYGQQGNGISFPNALPGAQHRLAAQNMVDFVNPTAGATFGQIRTDFDHPNGTHNTFGSPFPLPLEGTTADGDSGGPLFVSALGQELVSGILFGGFNNLGLDSRYGDISIWTGLQQTQTINWLATHGIHPYIPEPSAAMALAAAGGLLLARRRRLEPVN